MAGRHDGPTADGPVTDWPVTDEAALPLRERKQHRTRAAITDAAIALFVERGFDGVTVADIALRAEVGRTTFFRYFADKQEVLFADDAQLQQLLVAGIDQVAGTLAPLRDSLTDALRAVHSGLMALAEGLSVRAANRAARDQIIADHPQLRACGLVKERGYVTTGIDTLLRHGADRPTATLAANLGAACYATAHAQTAAEPTRLAKAIDEAFQRLTGLTGPDQTGPDQTGPGLTGASVPGAGLAEPALRRARLRKSA